MFDLLGLGGALRYGGIVYAPPPPAPHSLAFMYRCERCDVTGRTDTEGNARCWLCGGDEVVEYRTIVKDQNSLSGGTWTADQMPAPCERLVERSPVG